ncbi:30S ribosomal protein S18 [Candidatus Daviesbacteria bacterium RIFCSPHIGHO2_01_FULL_38_8]|nr:MAG: 30S ribosomal protein S18 [Candidatus Daviesbacteria bacterium RIFCSPHIGHO2_01_FULL_38_8]
MEREEVTKVVKKSCPFCSAKKEPSYTDVVYLRKFISDRARIVPGSRSSVCSKHQRRVGKEIKYARHLSMLPFVNKV